MIRHESGPSPEVTRTVSDTELGLAALLLLVVVVLTAIVVPTLA